MLAWRLSMMREGTSCTAKDSRIFLRLTCGLSIFDSLQDIVHNTNSQSIGLQQSPGLNRLIAIAYTPRHLLKHLPHTRIS